MFVIEKTLLSAYSLIEDVAEGIDAEVLKKALNSYRSQISVEKQAEMIISLTERKKHLINLKVIMDKAMAKLKDEDKRMLCEKYKLMGYFGVTDTVNRNYYRKLALAIGRFSKALREENFTEDNFRGYTLEFYFILEEYEKQKAKEISASNFGKLKNTSGRYLKPKSASVVTHESVTENNYSSSNSF